MLLAIKTGNVIGVVRSVSQLNSRLLLVKTVSCPVRRYPVISLLDFVKKSFCTLPVTVDYSSVAFVLS